MYNLKQHLIDLKLCEDNIYLDKYCELIISNLDTKRVKYKTQLHHIIPKYYFKENNEDVDNTTNNCVILSHKNHALAHYYLALCSSNSKFKAANALAIRHVLNNNQYKFQAVWADEKLFIESLDDYELLMEEGSKYIGTIHKGKVESIDTRLKKSKSHTGLKHKKMSDEGRENISKAKRGCTHVVHDSTKKKLSDTRKKLKLVNIKKNSIKKSVPENELDYWLSQGFTKGWGSQYEPGTRCWVTDGITSKQILKTDVNNYILNGWFLGRAKYHSEESKAKIAVSTRERDWSNIIWVNNGLVNKRVNKNSIPEGFYKGRLKDGQ